VFKKQAHGPFHSLPRTLRSRILQTRKMLREFPETATILTYVRAAENATFGGRVDVVVLPLRRSCSVPATSGTLYLPAPTHREK